MFINLSLICFFGLFFKIVQAAPGDVESIEIAENKYAESGSDVEIVCKIANFFSNTVYVYKTDGSNTDSQPSLTICAIKRCASVQEGRYKFYTDTTSVRVSISNLNRADDQKYWTCLSSQNGSKKTMFLQIYTTPTNVDKSTSFNKTSYDLSFESASFTCTTTCANPRPTFEWYIVEAGQSERLDISSSTQSVQSSCNDSAIYFNVMNLPKLTTSENNKDQIIAVECRVSFPTLKTPLVSKPPISIRYAVAVTQVQLTDMTNQPLNGSQLSVTQRAPYTVHCIPNESRPNPTLVWYLASVEIYRSLNSSYTFVPEEGDHGKALYCKAFNTQYEKDAVYSISSLLYVKVPPKVQITIFKEKPNEYDAIEIRCNATGRPENISFESIQHLLGDVQIRMLLLSLSNTVYIPAVQLQDMGTYVCNASNGVPEEDGKYFQTARKNLTIAGPPKIIACDLKKYASLKETVEIKEYHFTYDITQTSKIIRQDGTVMDRGRYRMYLYHSPITTMFYGKIVSINGFKISFLIDDVSLEDFADYTVMVTNRIGTSAQQFHIFAKEIPTHPTNFSFVGFNQHSPIFRWIGGFNGGAQQRFIIEISEAGKTDWKEVIAIEEILNTDTDTHVYVEESNIQGFSSGVYRARIWSVNEIGESKSDWNDYIEFKIKPDGMSEITSPTAAIVGGCLGAVIVILVVFLFLTGRKVYPGNCKKRKSNTSPPQLPASSSTAGERSLYNTLEEATEIQTYETLGKPDLETYENTKVSSL